MITGPFIKRIGAVLAVSQKRMADGSQVGADLVGLSRDQMNLQKSESAARSKRSILCLDS